MAGWFARWQERQRQLDEGADADLMQANRWRYRIAFGLIGVSVVLSLLNTKLRLPQMLITAFRIAAAISVLVGIVMAKWAQAEHAFLTRPEPERPPEITPK